MTRATLLRFIIFATGAFSLLAQNAPQPAARGGKGNATPPVDLTASQPGQDVVKVVITPSRVSVSRDGSYGVFADIENISKDPITLRSAETVLVVQPEVSHPNACVDWANGIFPTSPGQDIVILANEHYKVFWDLTASESHGRPCIPRGITDSLGFVPGDYIFTVEGVAYSTPKVAGEVRASTPVAATRAPVPSSPTATDPKTPDLNRHTFSETTILKVGISQIATAWAAFLGALLAYVVVSLQPGHDFDRFKPELPTKDKLKTAVVLLRNAFSAGLLGAAVTIVTSRLSDTQFPVKVSVNDFWGALTIGFVAYFIGTKLIVNLAAKLGGGPTTDPAAPASPAPTPANPAPTPATNLTPASVPVGNMDAEFVDVDDMPQPGTMPTGITVVSVPRVRDTVS